MFKTLLNALSHLSFGGLISAISAILGIALQLQFPAEFSFGLGGAAAVLSWLFRLARLKIKVESNGSTLDIHWRK